MSLFLAAFARGATDSVEVELPAAVGKLKRVVVRQIACPIDGDGAIQSCSCSLPIRVPCGAQYMRTSKHDLVGFH